MDRNNRVNKDLDEDSGNDDELRIKKYRVRNFTIFFTLQSDHSCSAFACRISERTCTYQELRNVRFSENVLRVLNEWLQTYTFGWRACVNIILELWSYDPGVIQMIMWICILFKNVFHEISIMILWNSSDRSLHHALVLSHWAFSQNVCERETDKDRERQRDRNSSSRTEHVKIFFFNTNYFY